jgi:hypothetical protein
VPPPSAGPTTVDVLDLTGAPGTAATVSAALAAGGYRVGTVTTNRPPTGTPPVSAIEYPVTLLQQATALAHALHADSSLRQTPVHHVTLLLTTADTAHLLAAVTALPKVCAAATPTPTH